MCRPVMPRGRIEISSVRPHERLHFRVDAHLLEEPLISQRSEELSGEKSLLRKPSSSRGEGGAARCEAAGPEKPEVYSLEYIEDIFGPRTMQMAVDRSPQQKEGLCDRLRTGLKSITCSVWSSD